MPSRYARDLTDAQWAILDPLIPEPYRRKDGRGRPWRPRRAFSTRFFGCCIPAPPGVTCPRGIRPIKLATVVFKIGFDQAF
jgi:hypothetical protein